jgi:hypothetical protein
MRITTRRTVGRLTSTNPAAAKMLRLPTWSSPHVMSCSRTVFDSGPILAALGASS